MGLFDLMYPQGVLSQVEPPAPTGLLGALAQVDPMRAATANAGLLSQFANQRAANPRPDVTDIFGYGPNWQSYMQNLQQNIARNYPTDSPDAVRQTAIRIAMNVGPLMTMPYQGMHKPPSPEYGAPAHDLTAGDLIPSDIYSNKAVQYYGTGDQAMDTKTINLLHSLKGKPDAKVSVFRAVPKDAPNTINPGDWVTVNRDYAALHGEGPLNGEYKIVEMKVPASSLWTSLDSIHEFGYHPAPNGAK